MLDVAGILQPLQQDVLQYIRYAPSTAYAHTYTGILPPDVNLWRTYNVTINVTPNADGAAVPTQPQPYSRPTCATSIKTMSKAARTTAMAARKYWSA